MKSIYLRAMEYEDLLIVNKLRNDDEIFEMTCGNKYYISKERDLEWIKDKIFNNFKQLYLIICEKKSDKAIGYISLNDIDHINKKTKWGGICILKEYQGKGYGTEAARQIIEHAFYELSINMIYLHVKTEHFTSCKLVEKVGFKSIGIIPDYIYKQNRYHNVFVYVLRKADYTKKF